MKTKRLLMIGVLSVILCMLLSTASPSIAVAKQIRLKFATWLTETTDMGQSAAWWIKEAERRTNGKVKIDAYWSQSLCTTKEMLAMTTKGAVDLGGFGPGYYARNWPLCQGLADSLHYLGKREESWMVPKLLKDVPALEKEMREDNNVIMLDYGQISEYVLFSRKPVRSLADLKGLRLRTWGEEYPKRWTPYGAVPTTVLLEEVYEGMQKGMFDAAPYNLPTAAAFGLQEVAKYCLMNAPILCAMGTNVMMNLDSWNKLPSDIQKTFLEIREDSIVESIRISDRMNFAAKKKMDEAGVEFNKLPDKEAQEWLRLVNSIAEKYLTEGMVKYGKAEDGKKLWNAFKKRRREYFEWLDTPDGKKWLEPTAGTERIFYHEWAKPVALGD